MKFVKVPLSDRVSVLYCQSLCIVDNIFGRCKFGECCSDTLLALVFENLIVNPFLFASWFARRRGSGGNIGCRIRVIALAVVALLGASVKAAVGLIVASTASIPGLLWALVRILPGFES